MLKFKTKKLVEEFTLIDVRLRMILFVIAGFRWFTSGKETVVTSLIRKTDEKSVHYYGRGADIRANDWGGMEILKMQSFINIHFPYGDGIHATIIFHGSGVNFHGHVQVKA